MKTFHPALLTLALLAATATTGCSNQNQSPAAGSSTGTTGVGDGTGDGIGDSLARTMAEARRKMEAGNITVSTQGDRKAEITPAGDLLINGKAVAINAGQRALLLDHRKQVMAIAEAGMGIGVQGAKLATKAMSEAITGIFSGNPDRIEKRVEAQAEGIKAATRKLCDRLPAMHASQQKLAAAIPEFAPFATMDASDIKDCRDEVDDGSSPPAPPAAPAAPATPAVPAAGTSAEATT